MHDELKTLRQRIQVMEEVMTLLVNESDNWMPMVMPPLVSQVMKPTTYAAPPTSSVKVMQVGA